MIEIRTAVTADLPLLIELLGELFAIEADFAIDPDKQAQGLQLLLDSGRIWVADDGATDKIVGMCSVQTLISTAEGGQVGLLEDLVVTAAYRGQGIGERLLTTVCHWADTQGLKRLQLLADRNNQPALAFYRKQGWQATQLIALRRLAGEQ